MRPPSETERRRLNELFAELCAIPSPFAGCDISGQSIGDTNYVNTELEPFVAVNPSDPTNVIGPVTRSL